MQQVQSELSEKQIRQHTDFQQQQLEDRKYHEKLLKEKSDEYETKIQLIKSKLILDKIR